LASPTTGRSINCQEITTTAELMTIAEGSLAGNVQVLWTQKGSDGTVGIPFPDGRYLALVGGTSDRNVWMAENF